MNRLRELREDADMTLQEVADKLGATNSAISKYELGHRALTSDLIRQFCRIYDCTADYLLGFSAQRRPVVSNSDTAILSAYHAAPEAIRAIVDTALAPYQQDAHQPAASAS